MTTINRIELPTPFVLNRVNCYYIHDSKPAIVDAGVDTEEAFEVLVSGIEKAGGSVEGIKRVFLTHAHADHIGLLSRIVDLSGAKVFIHRHDAPKMLDSGEEGREILRSKYRLFFLESGAPEDLTEEFLGALFNRLKRYFRCFEQLNVLNGYELFSFDDFELEIISTPGHSPGSICMLDKDSGTFFSGDTLLEKITSNPVVEVNPSRDNQGYRSLEVFKNTLTMMESLLVNKVMPGHGRPFETYRHRIKELLDHHEERTGQIIDALMLSSRNLGPDVGMTRYMITQELFSGLQGMDVFLGLSEIKGHLDILETRGIVTPVQQGARIVYTLTNLQ
ncbi:MAG: MBL fold metallo-hydrolase [Syntrophaceae bacterium]|nr:MBL fold metallo-hydrolase [Syntrophaceae bacterium]